jgi:hypothetical protein
MNLAPMLLVLVTLVTGAFADNGSEQQNIEHLMRHTWERPGAPLDVGPITVEGDHAVAGWTQGERGGRALLGKNDKSWRVLLCAGDALLDPTTLRNAGMAPDAAIHMSQSVAQAESAVSPNRVKQFALFKGLVNVGQEHSSAAH